jgi:hypothetical protein
MTSARKMTDYKKCSKCGEDSHCYGWGCLNCCTCHGWEIPQEFLDQFPERESLSIGGHMTVSAEILWGLWVFFVCLAFFLIVLMSRGGGN